VKSLLFQGYNAVMSDVTRILSQIESGDPVAAEQLLPLVYDKLRKLAAAKLSQEKPGQTLQATALVHEAYVRMVGSETPRTYRDRNHFFAAAATAMRRILVDAARAKRTEKRGGNCERKQLEDIAIPLPDDELLALHEALEQLAADDPLKARLVELRYFAGLTGDQAADVLGISASSADRHWAFARAWLQTKVRGLA
jgi:RNA polymerase sigma factor (TIGR02999 family)